MRIDIFVHVLSDNRVDALIQQGEMIMNTLQEVLDDVTAEKTLIASVLTLVSGLQQQLADALAGVNLTPAQQAAVDAIFTQVEENKAALGTALTANTPPAPPAVP